MITGGFKRKLCTVLISFAVFLCSLSAFPEASLSQVSVSQNGFDATYWTKRCDEDSCFIFGVARFENASFRATVSLRPIDHPKIGAVMTINLPTFAKTNRPLDLDYGVTVSSWIEGSTKLKFRTSHCKESQDVDRCSIRTGITDETLQEYLSWPGFNIWYKTSELPPEIRTLT